MTPRNRDRGALAAVTIALLGAWAVPAPAQTQEDNARTQASGPRLPPTRVEEGETQGIPRTGEPGITETVAEIMEREAKLPIGALAPKKAREHGVPHEKAPNPEAPDVSQWPPEDESAARLRAPAPKSPQTVGTTFLGIQISESGFIPPDTMGDVGPTQILVHSNGRIKVFDKQGNLGSLNASDNTFWNSVRDGSDVSDPHVRYDRLSGRWFVTIITIDDCPNHVLVAVSSGSTVSSTSSFTFFSFPAVQFGDYDTLGVDKNALYIAVNKFSCSAGGGFLNTTAFVVRKSALIAPSPSLVVTTFDNLIGASTGIYTPQGVQNDDPNATEGYFIGVDFFDFSELVLKRVSTPGATPSLSADMTITVPTTRFPILQVHGGDSGNDQRLDALDDRLFAAQVHTNKLTGVRTLWTAHNIQVNSSGVGSDSGGRNGSRWYQIGTLTGTPTVVQSGTLFDSAGTDPFGYWIPSVAMSGQGHMAIGASRASDDDTVGFARIGVAGRLRTDTAGTTQTPTLAQTSSTAYLVQAVDGQRWGDYSQTVVDPTNDQTMWTFQEYTNATNSWGVRAIQLKAPAPATPASASPPSIACGHTGNVTITGTSSGGTEFFDPGPDTGGPGFANHITGAVSAGVTVHSATFVDPTHVTLNIAVGASLGMKNVTITNPDGQQATGNNILNVVSGATSTVAGSQTICAGASTTVQATLTGAGPWNLTWSDGFVQNGVPSSPAIHTVTPGSTTVYSVSSVSDACGAGTASGTTTVNVDNDADCGGYFTVAPCRLVDTRGDEGPALAAGSTRTFDVVNAVPTCGIPSSAKAVAINLTAVNATTAGNLRLFPSGGLAPFASTINFVSGQTRANNAIASLGTSGQISVLCSMATGSTHFVLDVNGYFE